MTKKLFVALFLFTSLQGCAQDSDLGTWNIFNVKYTVTRRWSLFGEAQLRSLRFYNHYHYYEYKGGVNHKIHPNATFTIGAGSYQTYREGGDFVLPKNNDEFRIWPQIVVGQSLGKIKIEQRYRAEFRFTSDGYRNRFRYRLGLSYPFGMAGNIRKPYQLSASNELFFTNNEPFFERNRFLFAFNYKHSKTATFQVGYLHQFDYKINDETGRDFLQIGLFLELFDRRSTHTSQEIEIKDNQ